MDLLDGIRDRLADEAVAWLTTVTSTGGPFPTPVWFVADESDLVVFSAPDARKLAHIDRQPQVTLHLNSAPEGSGIAVITGIARFERPVRPSLQPGFLEKYGQRIARRGLSADRFDRLSPVRILIRPTRVWRGPGRLADGLG
jgi:PPOX class probable F420-dependent enzyme